MDQTQSRTFASNLHIDGENSASVLADAVNFVTNFQERGQFNGPKRTNGRLYEVLAKEPGIREFASRYDRRIPGDFKQARGLMAAFCYLASKKEAEQAEVFCKAVVTGVNLPKDHPALATRDFLSAMDKEDKKISVIGPVLIDLWNRYRRGETVTKVRVPRFWPEIE